MKLTFHTKLTLLIVLMVAMIIVPFAIWQEQITSYFESQEYRDWIESIKPYAWAIAIALLISDLFLPIPATPIMAVMGGIYGAFWGGIIAGVGSILAGLTAYAIARYGGNRLRRIIANDEELTKFQEFFNRWGAAGIIASRAMPVLPEVLTLLAGLAKMNFRKFLASLVLGSFSVAYALALAGEQAGTDPLMISIVTGVPVALWIVYIFVAKAVDSRKSAKSSDSKKAA